MSRVRIFFGALVGLIGVPEFAMCMADHSIGAGPFIGSAALTASALALLLPRRWTR